MTGALQRLRLPALNFLTPLYLLVSLWVLSPPFLECSLPYLFCLLTPPPALPALSFSTAWTYNMVAPSRTLNSTPRALAGRCSKPIPHLHNSIITTPPLSACVSVYLSVLHPFSVYTCTRVCLYTLLHHISYSGCAKNEEVYLKMYCRS